MKKHEFTGILTDYERLNCSVYGNPAYYGTFTNTDGVTLSGRTASDASCAYGFLSYREKPRKILYHITRTGSIIFDYIKILEAQE